VLCAPELRPVGRGPVVRHGDNLPLKRQSHVRGTGAVKRTFDTESRPEGGADEACRGAGHVQGYVIGSAPVCVAQTCTVHLAHSIGTYSARLEGLQWKYRHVCDPYRQPHVFLSSAQTR